MDSFLLVQGRLRAAGQYRLDGSSRSLSDLKEIGCKSA